MLTSIFCLFCLAFVSSASWMTYRGDRSRNYKTGKQAAIPRVPNAQTTIASCFYATTLVTATAVLFPASPLLLRIWDNRQTMFVGALIALAGEGIFLVARFSLGPNYSPCYDAYLPNNVTRDGIYRFSRHPLYVGNSIVFFGAVLVSGSLLVLVLFSLIIWLYCKTIVLEESHLAREVPGYSEYQSRTPLAFGVPRKRNGKAGTES